MGAGKLRAGMVGGGIGASIGPVHRMAICLDGQAEIVAGTFSANPEKSRQSALQMGVDGERSYGDYRQMAKAESGLPEAERINFAVIVTPNSSHFEIARCFLESGFHVVCEKPMGVTLDQAKTLQAVARAANRTLMLPHAYTGYPMVKQARHMVHSGELGPIRKVDVQYYQGWVPYRLQAQGVPSKAWKFDPAVTGPSLTVADIGIHAENLARYVTGLQIERLCADSTSVMAGHGLDDDASVLVHYEGGARGLLHVSQTATGERNGLVLRVYGEKKGLTWAQEIPESLVVSDLSRMESTLYKGGPYLCDEARAAGRLSLGHPEGLVEAFANLYLAFFKAIGGKTPDVSGERHDFPNVDDGVIGMGFVEAVLESSRSERWVRMKT
jgi:predicted dehydrogenase